MTRTQQREYKALGYRCLREALALQHRLQEMHALAPEETLELWATFMQTTTMLLRTPPTSHAEGAQE
jgi:hypothetical protein